MNNLKNISLLNLIPSSIKDNPKIISAALTLDKEIQKLNKCIENINIYSRIDELDETLINELAWQFHVDYYDINLPLEIKRKLVKESLSNHKIKGTPYAIEKVLRILKLKGNVIEWFECNGSPYHFLVELDAANEFNNIDDVRRLVMEYKNTRSWFDGFVILINAGTIFLINNTYDYPVFYKECGDFSGEKMFSQLEPGNFNLIQDTYKYKVEYPVSEKNVIYSKEKNIDIKNDTYTYAKHFHVTGEMLTLSKKVNIQNSTSKMHIEPYNFMTTYPVCGEFVCEGEE